MKTLICYVSGHGFGHAVRVIEVLRELRRRRPDLRIAIRTTVPRWLFAQGLGGDFSHADSRLDVGAIQRDSLSLDEEATLRAYAAIVAGKEALVGAEVQAIAPLGPAVVFADIPGLAFDIAARLGIPAVGMTNFSWDWIYADYVRERPAFTGVVDDLRRSYARADLLLRLPFHGDLGAFPRIRDIPLVARRAKLPAAETRRRLGLPPDDRLVLLSFGGIGLDLPAPAPRRPGVTFVATQGAQAGRAPAGYRTVDNEDLTAAGAGYEDLVAACDAVMTKPGYGIVADCIANGTPMIYTARGRFAEYPCLVEGIRANLPNAFLSNEDLHAARWDSALEAVLSGARPASPPGCDGSTVAATTLEGFLAG